MKTLRVKAWLAKPGGAAWRHHTVMSPSMLDRQARLGVKEPVAGSDRRRSDFCHPVAMAIRSQPIDTTAHVKAVVSVGAILLLMILSMSACGLFPGDPGPPIAVQGSDSESLGAVLLLLCADERVLSLTISENDSAGSGVKPGAVLWKIEAAHPSTTFEFLPGTEPAGFSTIVPAPPTIAGDIIISFETTRGTDTAGIRVRRLPNDVVRFQGRDLSKEAFYAKSDDVC